MSAVSASAIADGVRLYRPPESVTLREAYERIVVREHRARGKAESTLRDHRTHLDRWDKYWAERSDAGAGAVFASQGTEHRIINPMVQQIGRADLRDWREWLLHTLRPRGTSASGRAAEDQDGIARNVNKHLGTVSKVLAACADEGMLDTVPRLKPLDCAAANEAVSLLQVEVGALYRACDVVEWPTRGALSVLRWRTAVVIWTTYGLRCQELIAYEPDHEPLRWTNVRFDPGCPGNGGRTIAPHGWLSYVPQKQRRKKPRPVVVPLTAEVRRHLDALRESAESDDQPVIPVPHCGKSFYAQWHAIAAAASQRLAGRDVSTVQINHLRETCVTWHRDAERHPGIAESITGHAPRSIQQRHYDVPYARLVEHLAWCVWPEAFSDPLPRDAAGRQLRLF